MNNQVDPERSTGVPAEQRRQEPRSLNPLEQYRASVDREILDSVIVANHKRSQPRLESASLVMFGLHAAIDRLVDESLPEPEDLEMPEGMEHSVIVQSLLESISKPPSNIKKGLGNDNKRPDFAVPMYSLSRALGENPAERAKKAEQIADNPFFSEVNALGPYVNMRLADGPLIDGVHSILGSGDNYGQLVTHQNKVAVIDFSSPNIAKPFGINHIRSTVIGEALARLMEATGYTVVRDNHLGDWGTNIGNLLAAHATFAPETNIADMTIDQLTDLYVRFNDAKKTDPAFEQHGRDFTARLEAEDPELVEKWASVLEKSRAGLAPIYERLGIRFDTQIGERYFVQAARKLVRKLEGELPDKVVKDDNGTVRIKGQMSGDREQDPVVLMTSAGYPVYGARDLATIDFRTIVYDPDVILVVVGQEQSAYFDGIFQAAQEAKLNKRPNATHGSQPTQLEHIGFGMLQGDDGKKLSTRGGTSGRLEDILVTLDEAAFGEVKKRNQDLSDEESMAIAKKLSAAALIWNDLAADRTKDARFDIDRMMRLGGNNVIDVLYSYSRSGSILKRVEEANLDLNALLPDEYSNEAEHHLAVGLNEFSDVIRKAAEDRAPHILVSYLSDLAGRHGSFYEQSKVIGETDPGVARLRVELHRAYQVVVGNGLRLLNIPVVERI